MSDPRNIIPLVISLLEHVEGPASTWELPVEPLQKQMRPARCGTHCNLKESRPATPITPCHYLAAVALFSMFTTCTRRFASASGWPGSFSLLLP